MDSRTIKFNLRKVENFIDVFALNTLPISIPIESGLICNTDPNWKPGTHWIAIYRDKDGYAEFFDPYGIPPLHNEFIDFMNNNSTLGIRWSDRQLQCVDCVTCGYYCIEYIKFRCKNLSLNDLISSFSTDTYLNDIFVRNRIINPIL